MFSSYGVGLGTGRPRVQPNLGDKNSLCDVKLITSSQSKLTTQDFCEENRRREGSVHCLELLNERQVINGISMTTITTRMTLDLSYMVTVQSSTSANVFL